MALTITAARESDDWKLSPKAAREALALWQAQELCLLAIQAAQLARELGSRYKVRSFGYRLEHDSSRALSEITKQLREDALRLDLPAEPPGFYRDAIAERKAQLAAVKRATPETFDARFAEESAQALKKMVHDLEFQRGAIYGTGVARLIENLLPTFRGLVELADRLRQEL